MQRFDWKNAPVLYKWLTYEWYAYVSQDLIWKFSQVVSDFKNNQKLSKGPKIMFLQMNLTTKLIYKKTQIQFSNSTQR